MALCCCTRKQRVGLAKHVTQWKFLARRLHLQESDIQQIEADYSNDIWEQSYQMLLKWKLTCSNASYHTLGEAVREEFGKSVYCDHVKMANAAEADDSSWGPAAYSSIRIQSVVTLLLSMFGLQVAIYVYNNQSCHKLIISYIAPLVCFATESVSMISSTCKNKPAPICICDEYAWCMCMASNIYTDESYKTQCGKFATVQPYRRHVLTSRTQIWEWRKLSKRYTRLIILLVGHKMYFWFLLLAKSLQHCMSTTKINYASGYNTLHAYTL